MEDQIFNYEEILERYFGEKELIEEIVLHFVKKTGEQIEEIEQLIIENELNKVRFNAHSIKGGAINISSYRLSKSANLMEEAAKDGKIEECKAIFTRLEGDFRELKSEVDRLELEKSD